MLGEPLGQPRGSDGHDAALRALIYGLYRNSPVPSLTRCEINLLHLSKQHALPFHLHYRLCDGELWVRAPG